MQGVWHSPNWAPTLVWFIVLNATFNNAHSDFLLPFNKIAKTKSSCYYIKFVYRLLTKYLLYSLNFISKETLLSALKRNNSCKKILNNV